MREGSGSGEGHSMEGGEEAEEDAQGSKEENERRKWRMEKKREEREVHATASCSQVALKPSCLRVHCC